MRPNSAIIAVAARLLLAGPLATAGHADPVPLTFSGGSGTPLTITIDEPVTYAVTAAPFSGILFSFQGVGNVFGGTVNLAGALTYTLNGGPPISLNAGDTGSTSGAIAPNSLILFHNPLPAAALGDTVVLSPGTLTTAINIPAIAPASGPYDAILVDPNGLQVGLGAVAVPETSSFLLLGLLSTAISARFAFRYYGMSGRSLIPASGDTSTHVTGVLIYRRLAGDEQFLSAAMSMRRLE